METKTTHRNPLLHCAELGLTTDHLCIDLMHTLYLGIVQNFVVHCLWRFLLDNVWQVQTHSDDERLNVGCMRLRSDLFS
eukprot:13357195-Alexandrium_andersonii.AAC.1